MALTARILGRASIPGPTVLDLLANLAQQPGELILLHSSQDTGASILGARPVLTLEIDHAAIPRWIIYQDVRPEETDMELPAVASDPVGLWQRMLDAVILLEGATISPDGAQRGVPLVGWLGGISYDIGRHLEKIGASAVDDTHWPLFRWTLFDDYYVFDHRAQTWTVATLEWSSLRRELALERLDRLESILATVEPAEEIPVIPGKITQSLSREAYCHKVARIKEYIAAGDIYQANLAQRWTVETADRPEAIYQRLCGLSPAAHAGFLRFEDRAVLSASPELFLRRRGEELRTRPIKGTRPRDLQNRMRDEALKNDLLRSPKDKAELAMIVDLLRNDLGRICRYGTVRVTEPRELEGHPTVWHTMANIEGYLDSQYGDGWGGIVRAMCPGGSITGAPKIRAMQIIDSLEQARRGWYCGHLGAIGPRETGLLNIAIRTIFMQGKTAHVWAGGGIVADSDEPGEYEETRTKARAMLRALAVLPQEAQGS